jgi:hypothetical protein
MPEVFWQKATDVFNACLRWSHVPEQWKTAIVTMIPKEGKDWRTVKGYRPISLLSSLGKVLERLVARSVLREMVARKILPAEQSAFISGHSVEDHPFRIVQLAASGLICEESEDTFVVCLDVEGAFDRVWHRGLVFKLYSFGFPDIAIAWVAEFLRGRSFRVRIGNSHSEWRPISGGVPQGSPLSPILYVLYTADLVREIPRDLLTGLFADDTALAKRDKDPEVAIRRLNLGLAKAYAWFCKWRLSINATKSQALRISFKTGPPPGNLMIGGVVIAWVDVVKYLGIWLDQRLSLNTHVNKAIEKCKTRTSALAMVCTRRGLSRDGGVHVVKAYIRPVLTFGCQIYQGINDGQFERLEIAHNKALRRALRLPPWAPTELVRRRARLPALKSEVRRLAISWLLRAIRSGNLVGSEMEPLLGLPLDNRTYSIGHRRPPLEAMIAYATERP